MGDTTEKKKFKLPDTLILILILILITLVLGLVIPSGTYDYVEGTKVIDGNTFHYTEKAAYTFDNFLNCFLEGFSANQQIILASWIITGLFAYIVGTGALDRAFYSLSKTLKDKKILLIPLATLIFCATGSTGMLQMQTIALIPIAIAIAKTLKLDPLVGVAVIYCGTYAGYASTSYSLANVVLAQQIAGVEEMSGFGYRTIWLLIFSAVTCWYVTRYAIRVQKDINNSLLDPEDRFKPDDLLQAEGNRMSKIDLFIVLLVVAAFGIYIYKAIKEKQGIGYCVGIFLLATFIVAIITRTESGKVIKSFISGCSKFTYGGMTMGLAGAISVIMTKTGITHTIVHALSIPLQNAPAAISGVLMYIVNLIINFFIPSTSGKVTMVMPLLAPLADVIGVSRQIAVLTYCLADSIGNTIIPTHSVLIALISIAGVPYKKWIKFQFPLFCIWTVLALVEVVVATMIGF